MATLNPARRKNLVLAAATVYERQIELNGPIVEANWEKSSFQMRLADGALVTVPMPENFHSQVRSYGGRAGDHVTVKGFASYDSWDKLQKQWFPWIHWRFKRISTSPRALTNSVP